MRTLMSRDIYVQDIPPEAQSVADIPDDWTPSPLPFGRDLIIAMPQLQSTRSYLSREHGCNLTTSRRELGEAVTRLSPFGQDGLKVVGRPRVEDGERRLLRGVCRLDLDVPSVGTVRSSDPL